MNNFLFKNIANIVSILGILPLALLYLDNGYQYLLPLIIVNNIMDDLDGILATKLKIRSQFGADLDNVCDAVAHVAITLAVGIHFNGIVLLMSLIASGAIIIRATSRLSANKSGGSPTNELMRHLLFVLILANIFNLSPEYILVFVLILNTISMSSSKKMITMIRSQAKTITLVILVNILLVASLLLPVLAPYIAVIFFITYLYDFIKIINISKIYNK